MRTWGSDLRKASLTELSRADEKWECIVLNNVGMSGMGCPLLRIVEYFGGGRGLVQRTPSHGVVFSHEVDFVHEIRLPCSTSGRVIVRKVMV